MEDFRPERFGDIFFSPEDGLAESRHVFLGGNLLPGRWAGRRRFAVVETGFGTGLNFLAAWKMFTETAVPDAVLDYVSFERYPLTPAEIGRFLAPWAEELGPYLDRLLAQYPLRIPGFHRVALGNARLTLVFGDVSETLPSLVVPRGIDAWFLDGFAPAKNPDMWSQALFDGMARLSAPGATAATFTAAGVVRRGLAAAGFAVEKKKGFGRKRDMTAAVFQGAAAVVANNIDTKRIAIIGGGLAGTACAYVLREAGAAPVLFEAGGTLAPGASGNHLGLYNPRLSALRSPEAAFYAAAFALAVRTLEDLERRGRPAGFSRNGTLHLMTDEDRRRRFESALSSWGWHADHMRLAEAPEASALAGTALPCGALYLPDAGRASPSALCRAYAEGVEVRTGTAAAPERAAGGGWTVRDGAGGGAPFDAVILACGPGLKDVPETRGLPVHTVRGQVTAVAATDCSARLRLNLCYGGYVSACAEGGHVVGATFRRGADSVAVEDADHEDNLARLRAVCPDLAEGLAVTGGRAALRTASKDRFPVAGALGEGLFVSAAHGSHGIVSSLAAAHLIADLIRGGPPCLPRAAVTALSPGRFAAREARKLQAPGGRARGER